MVSGVGVGVGLFELDDVDAGGDAFDIGAGHGVIVEGITGGGVLDEELDEVSEVGDVGEVLAGRVGDG